MDICEEVGGMPTKTAPPPPIDAPAAKKRKTGPIDHLFKAQHGSNDASCKFVLKHAKSHEPQGYQLLRDKARTAHEEVDALVESGEWDKAKLREIEAKKLHKSAEFEESLFKKATFCFEHALNRYNYHRKNKKTNWLNHAKFYKDAYDAADAYLKKVPGDDFLKSNEREIVVVEDEGKENANESENGNAEGTEIISVTSDDDAESVSHSNNNISEAADNGEIVDTTGFTPGVKSKASRSRQSKKHVPRVNVKGTVKAPKRKPTNKQTMTEAQFKQAMKKTYTVTVNSKDAKGNIVYDKVLVDMKQEPFWELSNGQPYCTCCLKACKPKNIAAHCAAQKHKDKRDLLASQKQEVSEQGRKRQERLVADNVTGSTATQELHSKNVLLGRIFARGNIPARAIEDIGELLEQWGGVPTPDRQTLADTFTDIRLDHIAKIRKKIREAFPEFSFVIDGSPFFANAECIKLRMVDRDFNIFELVVHLELYEASLDSDAIANHIINTITERMKADIKNWRAVMLDRASTNKSAIKKIGTQNNIHPLEAYCVSHGTNTVGKKIEPKKGRRFLKFLNGMISAPLCKARDLHHKAFNKRPKKSSGIRFGVEIEHAAQVTEIGVIDLREKYIKTCVAKKYSEKSSKKALDMVQDTQEALKISCELATTTDMGLPVQSTTMTSESDAPTILIQNEVLDSLDELMAHGVDKYNFPVLDEKAEEAQIAMALELAPMEEEIAKARALVDTKTAVVAQVESTIQELEDQTSPPNRQRGRSGVRQNYKKINNPSSRTSNPSLCLLERAREQLKSANDECDEALALLSEKSEALSTFKANKLISKQDFIDHGKKCAEPAFDHYYNLFVSTSGDYYQLRQIYRVARLFNARTAAKLDINVILELINELTVFKFPEFTPAFLAGLKDEALKYKAAVDLTKRRESTPDDFWSKVHGAEAYDKSLATKIKKYPRKYEGKTWLDDPVERARRLWEWWRANHGKFIYFSKAARLIVLVQASSCAVERVFSQVKCILETIGDSALEETIECRLMERVNRYD